MTAAMELIVKGTQSIVGRPMFYAAVILLVALVYGRSLDDPFHFDDAHAIVENPNLRELAQVPRFFVDPGAFSVDSTLAMYRPLLLTTFTVNHAISGSHAWSHHLVNVVTHAAVTIAVFELLLLLFGHAATALLGALFFGLHPAHSEAVYYVSSRSESMAAFFVLLALILHLRSAQEAAPLHRGRRRALPGAAFAAGLLTKSTAIVFLPLVLLVDVLAQPGQWRQRWKSHVAYGVVAAAYVGYTRDLLTKATLAAPVRSFAEQLWSQLKGGVYYLHLLMLPRGLTVDHQFQLSSGPDPYAASALVLLASIIGVALVWRSTRPMALLLVLWFFVALMPASVVPLNVIVNEHRIYLSGVAFAAGGAWLARPSGIGALAVPGARIVRLGLWCVLPVFAVLALLRGNAWDAAESLWLDAMHKAPDMARPRFILGQEWVHQGRTGEAVAVLATGLERDPNFVPAYRLLAEACVTVGDLSSALQWAQKGTGRLPMAADLWALQAEVTRTYALSATGADRSAWFARSAAAYAAALEVELDVAAYHDNLGNTLQELGRSAEALAHHQRAVQLTPESAASWLNLGNAYWAVGRQQDCESAYLRAVDLDPVYVEAWANLAALYEQAGITDRAANARAHAQAARGGKTL